MNMSRPSRLASVSLAILTLATACHVRSESSSSGMQMVATAPAREAPPNDALSFAFWNVENLFDADDDPGNPGDDEFLPAK